MRAHRQPCLSASAPATSRDADNGTSDADLVTTLSRRLGAVHTRQRLGIEADADALKFHRRFGFFHPEDIYTTPWVVRTGLRLAGLYGRARRNAANIGVVEHTVALARLPAAFEGFRMLQISDPHVDMSPTILQALIERVEALQYDACVLTGDYRAATYGAIDGALAGMGELMRQLDAPAYAVLGNHDSIRMVPALEAMGIRMLVNESVAIDRGGDTLYLAGIDDAHYFRLDSVTAAAEGLPADATAILLSHTPEVYRQAAFAGFDLMLAGHTHGGQICLPGGYPIILDARIPRRLGRGHWEYGAMVGYTSPGAGASIADVRLNCPPEVTIHILTRR